jgi:predicted GNAT family N-acyltransferase
MTFSIHPANWNDYKTELGKVRREVFIEEQHVPEELEWDEYDEHCYHILARDAQGKPIGTGRIKPDGHIGRMAVLKSWRNKRVGSAILQALMDYAKKQHYTELYLHAQISAKDFYTRFGFEICSDEFMDAGIPHVTMKREL